MIKKMIIAAAVIQTLTMASTASAVDVDSVKVPYNKEALLTAQGREMLHRKLERSVKKICGSTSINRAGSVGQAMENQTCYDDTLAAALLRAGLNDAVTARLN